MFSIAKQSFLFGRKLAGISVPRVCFLHYGASSNVVANAVKFGSHDGQRRPTAKMPKLTDIGSRTLFGPEQDSFRETVRKFFQKEITPHSQAWNERGYTDKEIWEKAGSCGLLGINIPEEHGGIGGSFADACIIMEEHKYGSEEQKQKYIPDMTAGKKISAIAMTEPDAGSDLQGIKSFARKDGSDYILNGSKIFISTGWLADVVVVVAVTNKEAKSAAHGISLFIVDADTPGFKKSWLMKKIGLGASDTAGLFFEDVRLPASALLGEENKGFYYLMNELPQERLLIGVHACAQSEFMFEETKQYVMQRKAYGKTLSNLQTIQHKLAEMKTEICVARAFIDQCIALHEVQQLDAQMACMAKIWVSELENKIAAQCLQLHGGAGYLYDTPIARAYLDVRVQTIYGGSNEVLKDLIARQILAPAKKI
ncbi:long-chain specific acyl-CoA dehydrogenase, mitochondrial-like isoform X2 [Daphnia pulicaria]|uniref:long-chain specific acyl-CoA dehydrogenase, mitochondrial-like isoform X2 n=1 Tax=Daphnia pulicaria TaxID=35523 RepID=UPI001EEBCA0D|nr:long-chain specific acyl-CoA dehydrogenase, mitochondrial-like isoform X2 [Daphnia pulicaria]